MSAEPIGRRRFLEVGAGAVALGLIEHAFGPLRWAARQVWKPKSEIRFILMQHQTKEDFDALRAALGKNLEWADYLVIEIGLSEKSTSTKNCVERQETITNLFQAASNDDETFYSPLYQHTPSKGTIKTSTGIRWQKKEETQKEFHIENLKFLRGRKIRIVGGECDEKAYKHLRKKLAMEELESHPEVKGTQGTILPILDFKDILQIGRKREEANRGLGIRRDELVEQKILQLYSTAGTRILVLRGLGHFPLYLKLKKDGYNVKLVFATKASEQMHPISFITLRHRLGKPLPKYQETDILARRYLRGLLQNVVVPRYGRKLTKEESQKALKDDISKFVHPGLLKRMFTGEELQLINENNGELWGWEEFKKQVQAEVRP